jgi:DNA adenine methylase
MARYKTPLRYPGGKQKLAPFILEIMMENGLAGGHYAEPYSGGAGAAMELLLTDNASHIHLNDSCVRVYSFWRSVLTETEQLCRKISGARLNVDEWRRQKEVLKRPRQERQLDVGFSTFYLNRCNRSGILSGGLIGGLEQDGEWTMDARFPKKELIRRVQDIAQRADAITVKNWDAERFILEYVPMLPTTSLIYLDPPYFEEAERLYLSHYQPHDHARIARVIQNRLKRPWIVSYDAVPEIKRCYRSRRAITYTLHYNAAHAYTGKEVVFLSRGLRLPARSSIHSIDVALRKRRALRNRR